MDLLSDKMVPPHQLDRLQGILQLTAGILTRTATG
jgi:hypothetical protein